MAATFRHWSCAVKPETPLKLSSIGFAILWTAWMVWWSGVFNLVNVGILTACGALAAWLWFLAMRWYFPSHRPSAAELSGGTLPPHTAR
jgi:hypothetical protein